MIYNFLKFNVISQEYPDFEVKLVSFRLILRDISFICLGTFQNDLKNLKLLDTVFHLLISTKEKSLKTT